ncbi:hypothetical protein [Bacillus horti]|uniref:hypothetical protein n=1 Tax=Caldalkalibacillus horti TaxID=77523 RepID=UPI0027D919E0|nr:hypothetical protein [Bacillus horti]
MLSVGQEGIIEDLEINLSKMELIKEYFNNEDWSERMDEAQLLEMMTYLSVFIEDEASISVTKLMEMTNKSRYKLNQILRGLTEEGHVQLTSQRPKKYKVTNEFLESILIP